MPHQPGLFYNATRETFLRARILRKQMTSSERALWEVLRRNSVKGFYFRRQHPIWIYIADFYCHKAKLVIELDGEIHHSEKAKKHDAERDEMMKGQGITVLRFPNVEVFENLNGVMKKVTEYLK
ncbi:MAG: endonuclease domain-containing protein [Bacteroidota bacterium]